MREGQAGWKVTSHKSGGADGILRHTADAPWVRPPHCAQKIVPRIVRRKYLLA